MAGGRLVEAKSVEWPPYAPWDDWLLSDATLQELEDDLRGAADTLSGMRVNCAGRGLTLGTLLSKVHAHRLDLPPDRRRARAATVALVSEAERQQFEERWRQSLEGLRAECVRESERLRLHVAADSH